MSDQHNLNSPPFRPGFPSREQIAQWESWESSDGITNRFRYIEDHPHVWRGFRWRPIDIKHPEAAWDKKSYRPVDGTTPQPWDVAPPKFISEVHRLAKYNMMPQQLWLMLDLGPERTNDRAEAWQLYRKLRKASRAA